MSSIPPLSSSPALSLAQASPAHPSLNSELAKQVLVAASLESSLAETLAEVGGGQHDAGSMIRLQALSLGLSVSSAAISHVIAQVAEDAKNVMKPR